MELTEDWDDDYMTPDVTLTLNAHNFFDDPITDWKRLLPPYGISTVEVEEGWHPGDYENWWGFNSAVAGYAEGGCRVWIENSLAVRDSSWGSGDLMQFAREIAGWEAENLAWHQYLYNGYITVYGSHDLVVGYNTVVFDVDFELHSNAPTTVIHHITWAADTFEDWKADWENYTLNGLLPEIGSTDELFTVFGIDADDWKKEFDIDWSDLD